MVPSINKEVPGPMNADMCHTSALNGQPAAETQRNSRFHYFKKLVQTILVYPEITATKLLYRSIKLVTWVSLKTVGYRISGYHNEAHDFFEKNYIDTVKAFRDLVFIPAIAKRAFQDMIAHHEKANADITPKLPKDYLNVDYTKSLHQYSSYLHGCATFNVINPQNICEFPATSDAFLKTIMASHLFKPGIMAINFGSPNVATFVTERKEGGEDGNVETWKVDAFSLKRKPMEWHPTHGKIQSGVFLVPTNLPEEALKSFKDAASSMQNRKDITCVNTNCRVLQKAGFSIEGVAMEDVVFPTTMVEHLLFRNVFYTDSSGKKTKVHFDIVNTTGKSLEQYFEEVDTAVVSTRLRHIQRDKDTEDQKRARGAAAKALIKQEEERLKAEQQLSRQESIAEINGEYSHRRKVSVSVPSCFGDLIAHIWGRHTLYELDLSDKKQEIADTFKALAQQRNSNDVKLKPFPQSKPSFGTRLKKNIFFSGPMIRFLRRHMMGRVDTIDVNTQDIFKYMETTPGGRFNYALLDEKIVISWVHANGTKNEKVRKTADWALSKHALLAGREDVYCSGEMWYDETQKCIVMNGDSGTYTPSPDRVDTVVGLANTFFEAESHGYKFAVAHEEPK